MRNSLLPQRSKHQTHVREPSLSMMKSLFSIAYFKSETGQNKMTDYTPFYNSVNDLLSFKPTQKQFRQRIWKLKHKVEIIKKEKTKSFLFDHILLLRIKYLTFITWFGGMMENVAKKDRVCCCC